MKRRISEYPQSRTPLVALATAVTLIASLAGSSAALSALPKKGVKFSGATSQVSPQGSRGEVKFSVSRDGRRVRSFSIDWKASCDTGITRYPTTHITWMRVSKGGRFSFSGPSRTLGAEVTVRAVGRFVSPGRARGTFTAEAITRDAFGNVVEECRTGTVTWKARVR